MTRAMVFALLCAVVMQGCTTVPRHENAEKEILAMERTSLDNWAQGKPLGYIHAADSDMTYMDDIGAQSRLDGLDAVKQYMASLEGKVRVHTYELVNPKVQVYGEVGILTLQYHPSTLEGQPGPKWKATTVYHYHDGGWRAVHAHWSTVKEPQP